MDAEQFFFTLVRSIFARETSGMLPENPSAELLEQVYALAQKHDLTHLAAQALDAMSLPDCAILEKFRKAKKTAVFRYLRLDYELKRICAALEAAQIPFIPLKGAVLRSYYPELWMRTNCDIDILVREEQLEMAAAVLEEKLLYTGAQREITTCSCIRAVVFIWNCIIR